MVNSKYRGHDIIYMNGLWVYKDTQKTVINNKNRPCGYCNKENTKEVE
jgi:hypothetical protein